MIALFLKLIDLVKIASSGWFQQPRTFFYINNTNILFIVLYLQVDSNSNERAIEILCWLGYAVPWRSCVLAGLRCVWTCGSCVVWTLSLWCRNLWIGVLFCFWNQYKWNLVELRPGPNTTALCMFKFVKFLRQKNKCNYVTLATSFGTYCHVIAHVLPRQHTRDATEMCTWERHMSTSPSNMCQPLHQTRICWICQLKQFCDRD